MDEEKMKKMASKISDLNIDEYWGFHTENDIVLDGTFNVKDVIKIGKILEEFQ